MAIWNLEFLKPHLPPELDNTLRRLIAGDFHDYTPEQKKALVERIISASALAAAFSSPVPLLDLPIQAAMISAIAKVCGEQVGPKQALLRITGTLGLGMLLRQTGRVLPIGGNVTRLGRVYAATWALGQAAYLHYAGHGKVGRAQMRDLYHKTLMEKQMEQSARSHAQHIKEQLTELDHLVQDGVITLDEYRHKRKEILQKLFAQDEAMPHPEV